MQVVIVAAVGALEEERQLALTAGSALIECEPEQANEVEDERRRQDRIAPLPRELQ